MNRSGNFHILKDLGSKTKPNKISFLTKDLNSNCLGIISDYAQSNRQADIRTLQLLTELALGRFSENGNSGELVGGGYVINGATLYSFFIN